MTMVAVDSILSRDMIWWYDDNDNDDDNDDWWITSGDVISHMI